MLSDIFAKLYLSNLKDIRLCVRLVLELLEYNYNTLIYQNTFLSYHCAAEYRVRVVLLWKCGCKYSLYYSFQIQLLSPYFLDLVSFLVNILLMLKVYIAHIIKTCMLVSFKTFLKSCSEGFMSF